MYQEYKPRHPLAWAIIAGVALFSAVAVGAIKGWLPGDSKIGMQACAECAVVESVRTVETPMAPPAPELASTGMPADAVAQVAYSYETTVRYADGSTSVFSQAQPPAWQAGDKVKVVDGIIVLSG